MKWLLLAALVACTPEVKVYDDIDFTWDFGLTLDPVTSSLNTPYVKGAPVTIYIEADDRHDVAGWRVYSSDDSVFRINSIRPGINEHKLVAQGKAVGEGIATLIIDDGEGDAKGDAAIEVLRPDNVGLAAHGYMILDRAEEAVVSDVRMVEGGTATYLVRYFRGAQELHGNSVLETETPSGITALRRTSFLFENREWLSVTSASRGIQSIGLAADGDPMSAVTVITVPETDIASVKLHGQPEKGHEDGDWLVLLAQSYDASQRKIFGVDYAWEVGGWSETEAGDLYRYKFEANESTFVTAERNGHSDTVDISSDEGFVDSSNRVGCNTSAGGAGIVVALGLLGLVGRRRKSRSTSR